MTDGTLAFWMADLLDYQRWLTSPLAWIALAFFLWMLVDAIRREEWLWVVFIILFPMLNAILYFFLVYRNASPLGGPKFEIPGAGHRRRIQELQAQIHHLDKAHHHAELGDIYAQKGRFADAEKCYRSDLERDNEDYDKQAKFFQCLLRLGKPAEALPWLERVCASNPKHNYGFTLMDLAETYAALGNQDKALQAWLEVVGNYSYARARVELAQIYLARGEHPLAKAKLQEAIADDVHAPAFERRQERVWVKRAKKLKATLP